MEHLRPCLGKGEHIPVIYRVELHRVRYQARVGSIYAVDVGVDLAAVALKRRGEGDRRRVRAAAAKARYIPRGAYALKAPLLSSPAR